MKFEHLLINSHQVLYDMIKFEKKIQIHATFHIKIASVYKPIFSNSI